MWLGGSLMSLAAASSWFSEVSAAGTGAMPEARSRLKITFAREDPVSGAPLPRSRGRRKLPARQLRSHQLAPSFSVVRMGGRRQQNAWQMSPCRVTTSWEITY
jgi:hypothetical protein